VRIKGEEQDAKDGKYRVVGRTRDQTRERAELVAGGKKFDLGQDEDIMDTWFSSAVLDYGVA
jgi:valyl-tRNA synthetase